MAKSNACSNVYLQKGNGAAWADNIVSQVQRGDASGARRKLRAVHSAAVRGCARRRRRG